MSESRFAVVGADGAFRVVKQMPPPDQVRRAGPCFLVASRESGAAGLADFRVLARLPGAVRPPTVLEQSVLITEGLTPVAPGLLDAGELSQATAFELWLGKRHLATLPVSPVPVAAFTAEGGYKPPGEFAWTGTADEELQERLARLMGLGG